MGLNNNFGFKTLDDDGIVTNGKWPIFGFDVNNVDNAFRTTRIIDNSVNNINSSTDFPSTLTPPTDDQLYYDPSTYVNMDVYERQKQQTGMVKKLIAQYKHGYDYIPSGYYTVTGRLNISEDMVITQTHEGPAYADGGTYYTQWWYGDFTKTGNRSIAYQNLSSVIMYPAFNQVIPYGSNGNIEVTAQGAIPTGLNAYYLGVPLSTGSTQFNAYVLPGGTQGDVFVRANRILDYNEDLKQMSVWIDVEVDKEYVKIYKRFRWLDIYQRKWLVSKSTPREMYCSAIGRIKLLTQTTGSVFDVNVYLTPHKLEDLVINE